jgi:3D (Asp-Asp-Asp) domain-containing protein
MNKLTQKILTDITTTMKDKIIFGIIAFALIINVFCPQVVKAADANDIAKQEIKSQTWDLLTARYAELKDQADKAKDAKVKRTMSVTSTAYSSSVDQCDATPCITADGYNVCKANEENVVAANFLPFGTKIRIPEIFGDRVFTVHDRMNKRFNSRVDVWMTERSKAIQYGKRTIKIEILE